VQESLYKYQFPASKQSKVSEYIEEHQFLTNWINVEHDGWRLPATKEPHYWCGIWKSVGCLNADYHQNLGYGRRVYVKQFQRSCYRGACRTCYQKWIARESNKATRRINTYSELSKEKPIHLLLSIPVKQYSMPLSVLRKKISVIIKDIKLKGALIVFHPFRFNSKERKFYYAPHFHLVGFGYPFGILEAFGKHGWFIKNLGIRESVFQTISYLMSHCGIRKRTHTVTWIGRLSYSKLKVEKEPPNTHCPCCGEKFVEIYCTGYDPVVPPDKMYEGLVDFENWYPVNLNYIK
jgi:hypothetical protein